MTWDATTPAGTDSISLGDDNIREMKTDLESALSNEGVFPGPDTADPKFFWTGQRGATAGRPSAPVTGQIYFNTEIFQMEYWDGASWTGYDLVPLLGISSGKLANLAVTTAKIDDLAVTTAKLADLGVTTGKLNSLAVTDAKINDVSVSKITGTLPVANGGTAQTTKLISSGSYTGNGTSQTIPHGLGSTPTMIILMVTTTGTAVVHFFITGMSGFSRGSNGVTSSTDITSVDGTNFAVGSSTSSNQNTVTYSFIAFKAQ